MMYLFIINTIHAFKSEMTFFVIVTATLYNFFVRGPYIALKLLTVDFNFSKLIFLITAFILSTMIY